MLKLTWAPVLKGDSLTYSSIAESQEIAVLDRKDYKNDQILEMQTCLYYPIKNDTDVFGKAVEINNHTKNAGL